MTNHHERAARLRDFIEGLHHAEELDVDYGVELDGEIPKVPARYVASEYSGDESRVLFGDTLEEITGILADLGGGTYAYAPGETVLDLDTGWTYRVAVAVTLTRLTWQATFKLRNDRMEQLDEAQRTSGPYTSRHPSREAAVESLENYPDESKVIDLSIERVAPDE